jgi:hypothetical protein
MTLGADVPRGAPSKINRHAGAKLLKRVGGWILFLAPGSAFDGQVAFLAGRTLGVDIGILLPFCYKGLTQGSLALSLSASIFITC